MDFEPDLEALEARDREADSIDAETAAEDHLESLARRVFQLDSQIATFKRMRDEAANELLAAMPGKTLEVEGIGVYERRRKADRLQWQHADLQSALITKIRSGQARKVDAETGEVIEEDDIALTARVFAAAANPSWRLTELKKLGINPDEYAQVTYGREALQFHGQVDAEKVAG